MEDKLISFTGKELQVSADKWFENEPAIDIKTLRAQTG